MFPRIRLFKRWYNAITFPSGSWYVVNTFHLSSLCVYIDTRVYDLQSSVANSTQWLHDVLATYVFSDWALFGLAANTDLANMTRNEGHFNGSWKQLFALGGRRFSNVSLLKAYSVSPGWSALLIFDFKKMVIFLIKIKEPMDTFFPVIKSYGEKIAYINYISRKLNIWRAIISLENEISLQPYRIKFCCQKRISLHVKF